MDQPELTPLERLRLRDSLQDLWRDQVRLITALSLARYDGTDPGGDLAVETALEQARVRLIEIEQAMARLDAAAGFDRPLFDRQLNAS